MLSSIAHPGNDNLIGPGGPATPCGAAGAGTARPNAGRTDPAPGELLGTAPGVDLAAVLAATCAGQEAAPPPSARLCLHLSLAPVMVDPGAAVLLGLAVHELLRNAVLHAYPHGQECRVGLHLWPTGAVGARGYIMIADAGSGFGEEPPCSAGSGLVLARRFVEAAGCTLVREPGAGTVWRIGLA